VPVTVHRENGLAGFKRGRQGRRPYHEPQVGPASVPVIKCAVNRLWYPHLRRGSRYWTASLIRMCAQTRNIGSNKHEKPVTRHSRESGNPVFLAVTFLDSRLRGNDELSTSQSSKTECELVLDCPVPKHQSHRNKNARYPAAVHSELDSRGGIVIY
jgi:hypothetical protein